MDNLSQRCDWCVGSGTTKEGRCRNCAGVGETLTPEGGELSAFIHTFILNEEFWTRLRKEIGAVQPSQPRNEGSGE